MNGSSPIKTDKPKTKIKPTTFLQKLQIIVDQKRNNITPTKKNSKENNTKKEPKLYFYIERSTCLLTTTNSYYSYYKKTTCELLHSSILLSILDINFVYTQTHRILYHFFCIIIIIILIPFDHHQHFHLHYHNLLHIRVNMALGLWSLGSQCTFTPIFSQLILVCSFGLHNNTCRTIC